MPPRKRKAPTGLTPDETFDKVMARAARLDPSAVNAGDLGGAA